MQGNIDITTHVRTYVRTYIHITPDHISLPSGNEQKPNDDGVALS